MVRTDTEDQPKMKRILTLQDLIMYGVGATVGAGVLVITGIAAQYTGPSLCLAFVIAGIVSLFTGLSIGELSARMPSSSGGSYIYIYSTFGEFLGFMMGWLTFIRFCGEGSSLARSWSEYVVNIFTSFGITVPSWLYKLELFAGLDGSFLSVFFLLGCIFFI